MFLFFFFKQKTAYEMRISDWSSDVCSSDLIEAMFIDDIVHVANGRFQALLDDARLFGRDWGFRLADTRSEEHTSELQSLMRISYAVFCLKKKKYTTNNTNNPLQYHQHDTETTDAHHQQQHMSYDNSA